MKNYGNQYHLDDDFKKRARRHQSIYRLDSLHLEKYNLYGNRLIDDDAQKWLNYYQDLNVICELKKRYSKYSRKRDADMLRSEHIPFNFFPPFKLDLNFCKNVFNEFLGGCIKSIEKKTIIDNEDNIKIEFPPSPNVYYLNDGTSFDTYIEYTHLDNTKGIIGIEVKYTEREYTLIKYKKNKKTGEKELTKAWIDVENYKNQKSDSIYLNVTKNCKLYKEQHHMDLVKDDFRQIWRNHILGESILQKDKDKFKHFTSLTIFPKDNSHFVDTSEEYIKLLVSNQNKFIPLTYEDFLIACNKHYTNVEFKKWIDYLQERYIIEKNEI